MGSNSMTLSCAAAAGSPASARAFGRLAVLAASASASSILVATSDGLNDVSGRPLGTDFSNVYAAGTYVLDGKPAAAFDWPAQHARERQIFGATDAVLRLALSALFPVRRRAAGADALHALALAVVAGGDACALSRHGAADPGRLDWPLRNDGAGTTLRWQTGCGCCWRSPSRRCSSTSATATTAFSPRRCSAARWWCSTAAAARRQSCSA